MFNGSQGNSLNTDSADCLRAVLFYIILLILDLRYYRLADD